MGQRKKLPSPFSQSLTTTGSSGLAHAALQPFWGKDEVTNKRSARGASFCPAALDQAGKKQRESPLDSVGRKGGEWEQPLLGTLLSSLHIQSSHDESTNREVLFLEKTPEFSHPAGSMQDPPPSHEPGTHLQLLRDFTVWHFDTGANSLQRKHTRGERGMPGTAWGEVDFQKHFQKPVFVHPQPGSSHHIADQKGLTVPAEADGPQPRPDNTALVTPSSSPCTALSDQLQHGMTPTHPHWDNIQQAQSGWYFVLTVNRITGSSGK